MLCSLLFPDVRDNIMTPLSDGRFFVTRLCSGQYDVSYVLQHET